MLQSIMTIVAVVEWILVGVYLFTKTRRISKKADLALDELRADLARSIEMEADHDQ